MCGLLVTLGKTLVATIKFKSEDMEHYLIPGTTVSLSKLVDYVILCPNFCSTVGEAKRTLIDVNLTRAEDTIFKRGQTVSVSGVMAHMFKSRGEGDNTYLRCVGYQ